MKRWKSYPRQSCLTASELGLLPRRRNGPGGFQMARNSLGGFQSPEAKLPGTVWTAYKPEIVLLSVTQALFRRRRCWCQAGTHPRQFCATSFARNGLDGFQMAGNCLGSSAIAATTVFCNASSISETPLLVPSWKSRGKFCLTASEPGLLAGGSQMARKSLGGNSQKWLEPMARNGLDSLWHDQAGQKWYRWLAHS